MNENHPDTKARLDMLNRSGKSMTFTVSTDLPIKCSDEVLDDGIVFTSDVKYAPSLTNLVDFITQWHHDRNLIEGSSDKDQYLKLIQEAGELSDNICKGKDIADDIGDMIVVLINIAERNGLNLTDCLAKAWDDIKDRKGRMVDGIFIKEGD